MTPPRPFTSPMTAWNAIREAAPPDAELRPLADQLVDAMGVAWRDQAAAAHRDAAAYVTILGAAMIGPRWVAPSGDHQLAVGLFLAAEALRRCETRCRHASDLGKPRVVHLMLTIGVATCDACALPLLLAAHEQAPGGCDW